MATDQGFVAAGYRARPSHSRGAGAGSCEKIRDCHKRRPRRYVESMTSSAAVDCPSIFSQLPATLSLLLIATSCQPPEQTAYTLQGPTMGTTFTVKLVARNLSEEQLDSLRRAVESELENVNSKMSTYLPASELSRFNEFRRTDPFPVSQDTLDVFLEAQRISAATRGAFDVTVGPLVRAWGFGPGERSREAPAAGDLKQLRARIGWDKIEMDEASSTIRKLQPKVECDLSAIAKGYAVDRVSEALRALTYTAHMVEVGGEVRTGGRNAAGQPWRIGIERPDDAGRTPYRALPLEGLSMATSGDYRNYYEKDGQRFSHTIDPRTGRPVSHRLASVSVVHRRCVAADGWATALMVLGETDGYQRAVEQGLAALFLVRNADGEFCEKATPAFLSLFGASDSGKDEAEPVGER